MPDDYDPSDDYEEYETSYSLEDVCNRLDDITKILRDRRSTLSELVSAVAVLWVFFTLIPWMWHSKLVYSWRYGVADSQVNIEEEPTDCDFLHAPLGDKGCHYKRQVSTVLVRTDSSEFTDFKFSGPVRVEFTGAARNTIIFVKFIEALAASQVPKGPAPKAPTMQLTSVKQALTGSFGTE